MIKYSFVLPAYKALFFREALDSILAQTYKDFELIVVNDASPEDLDSIVRSYNDSRIRYYVNEKNIGGKDLVAQWNHCLEYAKGEYVILASDDDIYSPLYLQMMDKLVCKYPDVNVFRPRVKFIDSKGEILRVEGYSNERTFLLEFIYRWMTDSISSGVPFYIFKKSALDEIGGFVKYPLAWGSDDLTVMLLAKDGVVFSTKILFSFRMSDINISTRKNNNHSFLGKLSAMKLMFGDLKSLILPIDATDNIDRFYKQRIVSKFEPYMQGKTYALMMNTELLIVLKNIRPLLECKWVQKKWFIRAFLHHLLKRI